ncbi:transglycosylase SLT domain-containing protein [Rhodospira trueperi]|uniref:Transglycosylase SLT domain-containing protein n=1 Tax=Rhodospira trueperi TaxID=69960 RepID=A0A1G7FUS1_9PROT|nr:transglycosylase SLT domain-containing protein [Rhodospira trueperi]SDE79624.1 Transglycosylase SLT domain-containing protein [Rhodospira trueperi]
MTGSPVGKGVIAQPPPQQLAATVRVNGRTVGRDVLVGIRDASRRTGVDFTYMLAKAHQESGFRPDAANARGTARGLFQFTRDTWFEMVHRYGPGHGLGDVAAAIQVDSRGRFTVADPAVEARVLALRDDPRVSALMAAEYAGSNKAILRQALGRSPSATEIYLAHFLGPTGAVTFLDAAARAPHTPAERVLPEAAAANPGLFRVNGRPRTLEEVRHLMDSTITRAMRGFASVPDLVAGPPPRPPGAKPTAPPREDMGQVAWGAERPPMPPGRRPDWAAPPLDGDVRVARGATGEAPVPSALRDVPVIPTGAGPGTDAVMVARGSASGSGSGALPSPADGLSESAIARILGLEPATEEAGATEGPRLPGPSALAMAALLDDATRTSARGHTGAATRASAPATEVPFLSLARAASIVFRSISVADARAATAGAGDLSAEQPALRLALLASLKTGSGSTASPMVRPTREVLTGDRAERAIAAILDPMRTG